jgi:hypothetical protein
MTSPIVFLNGNPLFFFLDSDSPFNCLNASIKILLPYIKKFLSNKIGKTKFYDEQKRVKNCVSKYLKLWNSMFELPSSTLLTISKFMKKFPVLVLSSFIHAPNQN